MEINLSEQDYNDLMELTKELQEQENDTQAFPYYWQPASYKMESTTNDDVNYAVVYDSDSASSCSLKDLWDDEESLKQSFIELESLDEDIEFDDIDLSDWLSHVKNDPQYTVYYQEEAQVFEHNPSLFKSDIKGFIESNKHHLGQRPHTYARTVWRMPKMIKLIEILTRINPVENCNQEMKRYRDKGITK